MTQAIKTLLNSNAEFKAILQKTAVLRDLQIQFTSVVPAYLAKSSQVIGLLFGTLSIATNNATAAAKLKQLAPEIASQLRNQGCEVNELKIKVQVSYWVAPPPHTPRRLGTHAQQAIKQLEETLSDTPLKAALHKLVANAGRKRV